MKVLEKVVDERMRGIVKISEMQYAFVSGKGTVDAIFIIRQLQERRLEGNRKMYCAFVDLEKAYDRVPRELVYWCLRKRGMPEKLVRIVKAMYEGAVTTVNTVFGETEQFEVKTGLHQGSALSPFLFVLVLDVLSENIRRQDKWEMLFADDLVITAETEEELQRRVLEWQERLENGGLKVNAGKTEVMVSSKQGGEQIQVVDRRGVELKQVDGFKYLGSVIKEEGGCEIEVRERVRAGWAKWREVSGVVCDRRMPRKLKIKIYETVIRPVMLYGAETWALRKKEEEMMERTEMRMLRWMLGISLRDRLRNEEIRRRAGIVKISDKIREARLRWYGHVLRKPEGEAVKRVWRQPVVGRRSRGRQRLRWRDRVERDMMEVGLREEDAEERQTWRRLIKAADP